MHHPFTVVGLVVVFVVRLCYGHQTGVDRSEYRQQSVRMVADVLHNEHLPTHVFMANCWSPSQNAHASRSLGYPVSFVETVDDGRFQIAAGVNRNLVLIVVDLECSWKRGWLAAINTTYLEHPIRWLLLTAQQLDADESSQLWQNVQMWVDSHITVATWNSGASSFHLEQFYKIHFESVDVTPETYGIWTNDGHPRFRDERTTRILSRRRRNLQRTPLQASIVILNNASMEHLTDYKDNTVDTISKTNYMVVDVLMDILNATRRYKFVKTWGYFHPVTKKINGMLGDLKDGVSEIAGTSLYPTEERVDHFDYSAMIYNSRTQFIFRAPPLSNVANIYYLPFQGMVWLCSGALIFISCLAIYCSFRGAAVVRLDAADDDHDKVRGTDIVLLGIGAIAQMGSVLEAKFLSARISTIFFFIFMLFMYTSYTANIVSLLQATTKSIRTLEDLYRSKMAIGVEDTPYNRHYFPNTVGETRRRIFEHRIAPPNEEAHYVNNTYGVQQMRKGLYTFHCEVGPAYRLIEQTFYEHEKCGIVEMDYLGLPHLWVAVRKRTPYKEMIRINFFKIREHGIQAREVLKMYTKKPVCAAAGQSFQSVRLVDCYIVLQVLGIGCALAAVLFVLEVLLHRRAQRLGAMCLY